jgi:hypothetical protein
MNNRNSHHCNCQSSFTSSANANTCWQVYTGMNPNGAQPTFTYLGDGGPMTVNVSALLPTTIYRYRCFCGCGEEFKASGAEIQTSPLVMGTPTGKAVIAGRDGTSYEVDVPVSNGNLQTPIEGSPSNAIVTGVGGAGKLMTYTTGGHHVKFDDTRTDIEVDEDTQEISEPVRPAPVRRDPDIGDIVWSKATGRGPFTIIAGTTIDVRAPKLEIATPDGTYVRERTRSDEMLRLDAWMVRDEKGRITTFAKPELTLERQFARFNLIKVLMWAATFASFVTAGWLLHR